MFVAYLKEHGIENNNSENKSNIYDILKNLEILLTEKEVLSYSIVDKNELEQINEKLKNSVPKEIYQAEKFDK